MMILTLSLSKGEDWMAGSSPAMESINKPYRMPSPRS